MSCPANDRCDACGDGPADGLTPWRIHEAARPARHYQPSLRPPAKEATRAERAINLAPPPYKDPLRSLQSAP